VRLFSTQDLFGCPTSFQDFHPELCAKQNKVATEKISHMMFDSLICVGFLLFVEDLEAEL